MRKSPRPAARYPSSAAPQSGVTTQDGSVARGPHPRRRVRQAVKNQERRENFASHPVLRLRLIQLAVSGERRVSGATHRSRRDSLTMRSCISAPVATGERRTFAPRGAYTKHHTITSRRHLVSFTFQSARGFAILALAAANFVPGRAHAPAAHRMPGLSFRVSASTKIYPGDTPRGQDDEVMRGRGVAAKTTRASSSSRYTPAPQGVTTDDFLIALDSGKVVRAAHQQPALHVGQRHVRRTGRRRARPRAWAAAVAVGRGAPAERRAVAAAPAAVAAAAAAAVDAAAAADRRAVAAPGRARTWRARTRRCRRSGFLSQLELLDVNFKIEKLGAGDAIDGRPTQHYRITTRLSRGLGRPGLPRARRDRDLDDAAADARFRIRSSRSSSPISRPTDRSSSTRSSCARSARRSRARRSRS